MGYDEPKKRDSQETGMDEAIRHDTARGNVAWGWNGKRTYDVYQDFDIQAVRAAQKHADIAMVEAQKLYTQAGQNALVATHFANMQMLRHMGVESDALWNPVQQGVGDATTIKANQTNESVVEALRTLQAYVIANAASGRPPVNTPGS